MSESDSAEVLKILAETLHDYGAVIKHHHNDLPLSFTFPDADATKWRYFKPRLEKLQAKAAALTLESVIDRAPTLDTITNNQYDDLVAFDNDGTGSIDITFDDFIRSLQSDVTYYVYKNVILTH